MDPNDIDNRDEIVQKVNEIMAKIISALKILESQYTRMSDRIDTLTNRIDTVSDKVEQISKYTFGIEGDKELDTKRENADWKAKMTEEIELEEMEEERLEMKHQKEMKEREKRAVKRAERDVPCTIGKGCACGEYSRQLPKREQRQRGIHYRLDWD